MRTIKVGFLPPRQSTAMANAHITDTDGKNTPSAIIMQDEHTIREMRQSSSTNLGDGWGSTAVQKVQYAVMYTKCTESL